jgi:hypothetical protein
VPSDAAIAAALDSVQRRGGTVIFGSGTYLVRQPITIPSFTTVQGAGADATTLVLDVGSNRDPISIRGSALRMIAPITAPFQRGDSMIVAGMVPADTNLMVRVVMQDEDLVESDWARGSVGQLLEVRDRRGDTLVLAAPLRFGADLQRSPYLVIIRPAQQIRLRCLTLEQRDSSAQQVDNISVSHARDVVIDGVRSRKTNFAHVTFEASMHCTVARCDFAESFGYGGGGRGYGVVLQFTSGDIRVEDNVFSTLRHSMLLQAGANGNVLSYNASAAPYWEQFPNDAAGDVVLHGNWVFGNLAEGNDVAHIVIDNSHGANGHFNAFLRNRAREYGFFMGASPYADSTMILGNEITNTGIIKGLFITGGSGLLSVGNEVKGRRTPASDTTQVPTSFVYGVVPERYSGLRWPPHGTPSTRDTIPARRRQLAGTETCPCTTEAFTHVSEHEGEEQLPAVLHTVDVDVVGRPAIPSLNPTVIGTYRHGTTLYRLVR